MTGVAWCTGAGKGIGRALSLEFARRGIAVAASARTASDLDSLTGEAAVAGGVVRGFPLDVVDAAATAATVEAIEATMGPIEMVVLNAGTHLADSARSFDPTLVRRLVEINLMGTVNGLAAILPRFVARRRGRIAVVSSVAGYRGLPSAAAYGATKAALINLCEAMKPELDRCGVRLYLVNPGFVRTPLTDKNDFRMPFLMEPDAAARRIADGLERGGFEITFPRRFTWGLKLLRCLPYPLYFALTRGMVRDGATR